MASMVIDLLTAGVKLQQRRGARKAKAKEKEKEKAKEKANARPKERFRL